MEDIVNVPPDARPKVGWRVKDAIAPIAVQRIKQDIGRWRMAIQEAETPTNPQRYLMQQMYLDTVLNGHVTACIEKRYAGVLKKGIEVVNEKGEQNEDLTKLYSKRWMFDIIRYILDARMYGYTLIQLGDMKNFEFEELYTIRRSNINPEKEIVTKDFYSLDGISVYDPQYEKNLIWVKTISEVGMAANWGKCGNGLLYKVAPYEIWYRQAIAFWNEYLQRFGAPMALGKTNSRDEQMRSQMSEMLSNMGSMGWGVFDTDDDIELIESAGKSGSTETYPNMINMLEKIISKIFLGHADGIDSVPGKLGSSQGDKSPAYLALKDIEAFDCQFVEFELEKNVMPKLIGLGFPLPKGYTIKFVNSYEKMEARATEDTNNKVTAEMVKVLFDAGLKVDAKWFEERTGIPVEDKPEPKADPIKAKNLFDERIKLENAITDLYNGCSHTE
jgi:phage gp29-like protein